MAATAHSQGFPKPQYSYPFVPDTDRHRSPVNSRLRLIVAGLPTRTSTLDIYENFCAHGSVVRIYLFETRDGFNSTRAEVDFQPAPTQSFWHRPFLFETRSNGSVTVRCQVAHNQPQNFFQESPIRKGVKYEQRTELIGKSLDFGVLTDPTTMMVMRRSGSMQHTPKLVLHLNRKEIEIQFPWEQISSKRSAMRTFRFVIALDEQFKIWQLSDGSFVLHLEKPPWYSKQLAEAIAITHSPDARIWSIEDTWARQTDLWTYKQCIPEINSHPIALPKHLNDINIFRWTTFRFDPVHDNKNTLALQKIVDALRDWNVRVLSDDSFKTFDAESELDKKVWNLIHSARCDIVTPLATRVPLTELPFSVKYHLEVCLSNGWLSEYSITPEFLKQLSDWPELKAKQALLYVAMDQKRLFDPTTIFSDIHYSKPVRAKRLPGNCIEICSATVTATGILFHTPAVEITNRIIRNHKSHAHRFLRVRFEDDEYRGQTRLYSATNNKMVMIFTRVKRALTNGIRLGDVTYDFLAWGNSQLREHGAYFFAGTDDLTADSIRAEMGDFSETVVAKKAARMGQCFSTTRPVRLQLKMVHEPDAIPDTVRNGYTFTDGVGKISPAAAELVASQLQIKGPTPCLFQFRLGGCKGVLAVSKDVPGIDVRIRKSQLKFNSLATELEINRYAQFWQPCLNRQIILCLSSLGVPTQVFLRKQDETIAALNQAMHDDGAAINALRSNIDPNMMTLSLSQMVEAGFRDSQEPFVVSLLELWRAWSLKHLKEKAKIPIEKGAFVLGTVDETATLQGHTSASPFGDRDAILADPALLNNLPEIFLQFTDHKTGQRRIIEGICILARNPSLHRGDIRVVRARNVPALHHMCDVVVMPQLGDRDLPSMCSGGDLDGDDYIVIWDQELIPKFWNAEPFHYEPPVPKMAAGEIKTSDLIDFFHDYMQNDALGKIAHAHLAAADFLDDGLESKICLDLVQLHSMAVDYPKTGVPAVMERRLERTHKPHFMEPKHGRTYVSHKVLGQLYDKINKFYQKVDKDTFVKHDLEFDARILDAFDPDTDLLSKAEAVKGAYDVSLQRILTQHSIRTEFELWSTFVLEHSKKSRDYKFHEEVGDLSRILKEEYHEELCELAGGRDFDHLAPVAVAAYRIARDQLQAAKLQAGTQQEGGAAVEMPFISFPWILQDTMVKIAGQTDNRKGKTATHSDVGSESKAKVVLESTQDGTLHELHDIADFRLTRDKLSPYLPDPLVTNIIVPSHVETNKETGVAQPEPEHKLNAVPQESCSYEQPDVVEKLADELRPKMNVVSTNHMTNETLLSHWNQESYTDGKSSSLTGQALINVSDSKVANLKQSPPPSASNGEHIRKPQVLPERPGLSPRLRYQSPNERRSRRRATCFFWKMYNNCIYSEQECKYAHHDTGINMLEKQQATCYFWANGNTCTFDSETCKFAHFETGYHAPQPIGSKSSKGRDDPGTKRVIANDSDDDDDIDYLPAPKDSSRSWRQTRTNSWETEHAKRQERMNRRNSQQPEHYNNIGQTASPGNGSGADNRLATPKPSTRELFVEQPIQGSGRSDVYNSVHSRELTPVPVSPTRLHAFHPEVTQLISEHVKGNDEHVLQPLSRPQLNGQLIDFLGKGPIQAIPRTLQSRSGNSHANVIKSNSSWAEDLKDLIFDDQIMLLRKDSIPKADQNTPMTTNNLPSPHSGLIDIDDGTPKQHETSSHKLGHTVPTATTNHSYSKDLADLLLDDCEPAKPDNIWDNDSTSAAATNSSDTSPMEPTSDLFMRDTDHRDPMTHPKMANSYDDPLTCGDGKDEEPEIEELFD